VCIVKKVSWRQNGIVLKFFKPCPFLPVTAFIIASHSNFLISFQKHYIVINHVFKMKEPVILQNLRCDDDIPFIAIFILDSSQKLLSASVMTFLLVCV
jgi:hypothetical protein